MRGDFQVINVLFTQFIFSNCFIFHSSYPPKPVENPVDNPWKTLEQPLTYPQPHTYPLELVDN